MKNVFLAGLLTVVSVFFAGCASDPGKAPTSILGESPRQNRPPLVDSDLNGLWAIKSAELAGKPLVTPPNLNCALPTIDMVPDFHQRILIAADLNCLVMNWPDRRAVLT